jgi:aspartate aminotransferase
VATNRQLANCQPTKMPSISLRGQHVYASPIRKLAPFADAAKARGRKVYHLNIGQPDILTPVAATQHVRDTQIDIVAYTPSKGIQSYRDKLPRYYQKFDIDLSPEEIIVTSGASEGIILTFLACLNEGEEVIIPEPFYANYNGFAQMANVTVLPITSTIDTGFALPPISSFEAVITSKTKAIFLCNPNNPTGCLYGKEELEELAQIVKKHDLYLFIDEVYREFCYDAQDFYSALRLKGIEENVVVLDSISKRYSSCGARVGAIVTRNQKVVEIITKYAELRLSVPTYGQILAEALIDTPDSYLEEVKEEYVARRNLLYQRLSAMKGVRCYQPGGAFYVFAELPIEDSDHFCQWILEDFDYENQTVMLAPGTGFYANRHLGLRQVRIAYVLNTKDLNKAMDCLEQALEVYKSIQKFKNSKNT